MHRPSTSTMSNSFFTHGLIGIDSQHAQAERAVHPSTSIRQRSVWTSVRNALGTFFITAGTILAGDKVNHSTESRPAH